MATRQTFAGRVTLTAGGAFGIDGGWLDLGTDADARHKFMAPGSARALRVQIDTPPGVGKSRTLTAYLDGVASSIITVTISDLETEATISGTETFTEGTSISIVHASSGSPVSTLARISLVIDYDDPSVACYGGGGAISGSGSVNTGAFSSGSSWDPTGFVLNRNLTPRPGTIDKLGIELSDPVPAGETLVVDVRQSDGSLAGVSLTLTEGETSKETDCSVAFLAEERIGMNANASWAVSSSLRFGIRVTHDEDGVSFVCSRGKLNLDGPNHTRYSPPGQGSNGWDTTVNAASIWGGLSAFQLGELHVGVDSGAFSVSAVSFTLFISGAASIVSASTPAKGPFQSTLVSDLDSVSVDPTDKAALQVITGSNYFQSQTLWGMVQVALASPDDEEPDSGSAEQGSIGPIIWVTVPREEIAAGSPGSPDSVIVPIDAYSDIELQDPSSYYGSWKDPWLLHAGDAARVLSDPLTGELTASTFQYSLADPEFRFREQLGGETDRYWTRYPHVFRMTSRATRAVLGRPFVAFAGPLVDAQPTPNAWDVTLGDLVTQRILRDKLQIPWRLIRDGFLTELDFVSEKLDLEQPEPIIFGTHDRATPDQGSPITDSATGYRVVPIYLGIDGSDHVWMVAGHACKSVIPRVDGEVRDAGDGWVVALSEDRTSSTYGVTRRYTLIRAPFGGDSTTWRRSRTSEGDQVVIGDKQLTADVEGIEDVGDSSGTLITDLYEQEQHFIVNYVANGGPDSYQSGAWLECPTWDITDQVIPVLDLDSFAAVSAIAAARLGSELVGAVIIGARAGDRANAGKWIADFNRSGWCQFGQVQPYQLGITTLHPTQAAKDAAVCYTDNYEMLADSFSTSVQWDRHRTSVPWRNDYEHTTGLWQGSGVELTPESTNYPETDADIREYPFAPGHDQGSHLASLEAILIANPPRMIRFSTTVGPTPVDNDSLAYRSLGEYITYLHFDAVQPDVDARSIRLAQVQRVTISGSDRRITVDALDCDDLIGSAL